MDIAELQAKRSALLAERKELILKYENSEEEAKKVYDLIFREKFKIGGDWLDRTKRLGRRDKAVVNLLGGVRHLWAYMHPEKRIQSAANRRGANCVDMKTQCLTENGWKYGYDLKVGDKIYTKNPNTGELELQPIKHLTITHYEGKMWKLTGSVNALVTPNHRWLIDERLRKKINGKQIDVGVKPYFVVSDIMFKHKNDMGRIHLTVDYPHVQKGGVWTNDEVRLIGWILTDGYYEKRKRLDESISPSQRIGISQSFIGNPQKVEMIDSLFKRLNIKFGRREKNGYISWRFNNSLSDKIRSAFPNKILTPSFLQDLSTKQLKILFDTMLLGNGTWLSKLDRYHSFCAATKKKANAFSMLCVLLGISHNLYYIKPKPAKYAYASLNYQVPIQRSNCWIVAFKQRNRAQSMFSYPKLVQYKGDIWCPTVKNGTFIAKRMGSVYITGNSAVQGSSSNLGFVGGYMLRKLVWDFFESRGVYIGLKMCNVVHDSVEMEVLVVNIPLVDYLATHAYSTMLHRWMRDTMQFETIISFEMDSQIGPALSETIDAVRWDDQVDAIRKGLEWKRDNLGSKQPIDEIMKRVIHNAEILYKLRKKEIKYQLENDISVSYDMLMTKDNALNMGLIFDMPVIKAKKDESWRDEL